MPRRTSLNICVFPSLEHSTWCVHKLQTILGLLCVPLVGTQTTDGEMPSLCQTKHNRAKPMSELSSALFSIADDNEFRFARLCFAFTCSIPVWHLLLSGSLHLFLTFVSAVYGTESDDRRHNVQHKDKVQYRQGNCCPHGQLFFTARPDAAA